jgi:tRNA A37 threonylcarbamoyladenosine biosynthesis protein TsaE
MDKIVEDVIAKYRQRSELGIAKYGTTLDENKATLIEWLTHLQEELMDATLYIEKLKSDLDKR